MSARPIPWLLACLLWLSACGDDAATRARLPQPEGGDWTREPRLASGIEAAQDSVARRPSSADAWGTLGGLYLIHGWNRPATACLEQAIELSPETLRWHYLLGRALADLEPERSLAAFQAAIALDPDYAPAHAYAGLALRRLDRPEAAREHFEHAEALDPGNAVSQLNLGQIAAATGQYEDARTHLQRALAKHPDHAEAHAALAAVLMRLGEREAAKRHARLGRADAPTAPMADPFWADLQTQGLSRFWFERRGTKYLADGQIGPALQQLAVAVEGEQTNPEVWLNYGAVLLRAGSTDDAIEALERGLAFVNPDKRPAAGAEPRLPQIQAKLHANLGVARTRLGDLAAAAGHLEQARALDPADFDAARNLAVVYNAQGRTSETIEALEAALAIRPDPAIQKTIATLRGQGTGNQDATR